MSSKKQQKLDALGVSAFCESMGMMVQAGIQSDEAVSLLLQDEGKGGALEQALEAMHPEMELGTPLSQAMENCGAFPDYAVRMLRAGEESGRTEDVLFRLSAYYAEQKTLQQKLSNALTYPAAMLVLIVAVLLVMLTMVLPVFTDVYTRMTGSLAASSYGYIRWAYGLCWAALILMVVLAVVLIGGMLLWNTTAGRPKVQHILEKLPVSRSLLESMGLYRFTSALSIYLASGIPQDLAVLQSREMTDCAPVEAKLKLCTEDMEEGHSIAQAAYTHRLFEPVYGRMLLAGDRSGNLEDVLAKLSTLLQEHCGESVDRLVGLVDPLLSGVLMLTVGLSLISVMLPLIGMMTSIG